MNSSFRQAALAHLQSRVLDLNDETKRYEEAYEDIVESIKDKRQKFYGDYSVEPPSKEKALELLHQLQTKDISVLRRVTKPTQSYEFFISPLLVLFDKQPQRQVTAEGKVQLSNWQVAY